MGDTVNKGTEGTWELSIVSDQFCCAPKTAVKNKVYFFQTSQSSRFQNFVSVFLLETKSKLMMSI